MSKKSALAEFQKNAAHAYEVRQLEKKVQSGELVRFPGYEARLPRDEAEAFKSDLEKEGLAIVGPDDDKNGATPVYLPDGRNFVLVRELSPA